MTAPVLEILGKGGRFTFVNRAAARLLGYTSASQLYGKNWRTVFSKEESRRLDREIASALADGKHWFGEVDVAGGGDGDSSTLELSVSSMEGGGASWIVRDGSVRDSSIRSLRASEERYRSLFKTAGSVLVVLDDGRGVVEWNTEAERRFGEPRDRALGRDFLDLVIPEEIRTPVAEQFDSVLTTGRRARFETPVRGGEAQRLAWNVTYRSNQNHD